MSSCRVLDSSTTLKHEDRVRCDFTNYFYLRYGASKTNAANDVILEIGHNLKFRSFYARVCQEMARSALRSFLVRPRSHAESDGAFRLEGKREQLPLVPFVRQKRVMHASSLLRYCCSCSCSCLLLLDHIDSNIVPG